MNDEFTVLIVEDHQLIIDSYNLAITRTCQKNQLSFTILKSLNLDDAFDKLKIFEINGGLDLLILDISLPPGMEYNILNGEAFGIVVKKMLPSCRIFVCTSLNDSFRLNSIFKSLSPDAFLIKSDITFLDLVCAIQKIIENDNFYSRTILTLLKNNLITDLYLDELDMKILYEISHGSRMKELLELIPLSKTGIERRKRNLKKVFDVKNNSDRDLIIRAREKGFI